MLGLDEGRGRTNKTDGEVPGPIDHGIGIGACELSKQSLANRPDRNLKHSCHGARYGEHSNHDPTWKVGYRTRVR